jgi:hypothetical protein
MSGRYVIQARRDIASNWASANPVLADGEIGFESNTGAIKLGDGSTAWTSLPYLRATEPAGNTDTAKTTGYVGIPQVVLSSGNLTLSKAHAGKHIYVTGSGQTITIPANSLVPFEIGSGIVIINSSSVTTFINIQSTDTLRLASSGNLGQRTIGPWGIATIVKITSTSWIITGNGVT